jgi:hypothetical protein
MLIYHRCRLRAAVAIRAVEIESGNAVLAEVALESSAAAHRCSYVISHTLTVALLPVLFWDKRCATLEQETLSLAGSAGGTYFLTSKSEQKQWWKTAVVIRRIEKNPLNLTHCKFLESRLCSLALACSKCDFKNKVAPQLPSVMSKGEQSSMDDFLQKAIITLSALGWNFFQQLATASTSLPSVLPPPVPLSNDPPEVPQSLKPLLDELRNAATGSSFPKAEWYWTRTPDYRAKVVNDGDFRVFFRIVWSKNWFWLKLKDVGRYKIAKTSDIDNLRKDIETAYRKAEQYLQRGK